MESKRKLYLLLGFTGMFLCGIGDILFAFRGDGEPYAVGGLISMHIDQVPLWYYRLSFLIGIVAMIGYWLGSRAMLSYITDQLNGRTFELTPELAPTNDPDDSDNIIPEITVYRTEVYSSKITLPVIPKE